MTSVDDLLDTGAVGLRFFEAFLPRVDHAGAVPTATVQDLAALYDQQRGTRTDVLSDDAESLFACAAVLRECAAAQRAASATLESGWTGADASAAGQMFATGLDRADECVGAVEQAAEALRSAAAGLTDVITEKSTSAAQFDRMDACGRTATQVDATIAAAQTRSLTPEQRTDLATLYPGVVTPPAASGSPMNPTELILVAGQCSSWLTTEFVPYMAERVTAFRDMCAHTDTAVRAVFDAVGAAFAQFDDITFPRPDTAAADCSCEPAETPPAATSPARTSPAATSPAGTSPAAGPTTADHAPAAPSSAPEEETDDCVDGDDRGDRGDDADLVRAAVRVADAVVGAIGEALTESSNVPALDPTPTTNPSPVADGPGGAQPASANGSERGHLEAELDGYGARLALSDNGAVTLSLTDPTADTREFTLAIGPNGLPVLTDTMTAPDHEPAPAPAADPPAAKASAPQPEPTGPAPQPDTPPAPPPAPPAAECAPDEQPGPDLASAGENAPSPAAPDLAVPDLAEAGNL